MALMARRRLRATFTRARSEANLKLRQPLAEVIVATDHADRRRQIGEHVDLIGAELGVKAVRLATSAEEFAQTEVVPMLKVLGPKHGRDLAMIRGLLREGQFELRGDSVQVGDWTLEPGEFELRSRAREGFAVTDGEGFVVALDTEITPELKLEGVVRDLIRQIQDMRKDAGLEIIDRIRLTYPERDGDVTRGAVRPVDTVAVFRQVPAPLDGCRRHVRGHDGRHTCVGEHLQNVLLRRGRLRPE
jgi:isoleucyl-tRNA synthetase